METGVRWRKNRKVVFTLIFPVKSFTHRTFFSGAGRFVYSLAEPRKADLLPNCVSSWEKCSQQIPDSSAQGFLKLFLSNASGQPDQNLLLMKQHFLMFVHFWHSGRFFVNICKTPGISPPQSLFSKRALAWPHFVISPAFYLFQLSDEFKKLSCHNFEDYSNSKTSEMLLWFKLISAL